MSNLFDNMQFKKHFNAQNLNTCSKSQEIFTRWHALLSTTSKNEEQLQTDFLNDIFGDVLGYTYKRGEAETNLEKEEKTELDGQKPDGILGFFNEKGKDVRVVIELKDQKTDLDKKKNRATDKRSPVEQAFGYVSKYQGVEWVIVSNFKEIRLYKAGYAGKYHSFTMEELANNLNKQKEFHFLLAKDRLFTKKPNTSPVHALDTTEKGEEIEKRFYKHYSTLREEIWHNLVELNKEKHYGRNFYLYKAQKLIDRIVFIRFCRENGALDNDAVLEALNNKFVPGKYNRLKFLFQAMDEGNPEIGIAKFNGGLFATDADLDCLNISDEIIEKIVILYSHDFGSDLDVNILGHIFEQSISDLENLTGDNEKKRKKDGVFYTPAYITEYIVREAVGGWLNDRKAEIKAKENSKEWWQQYAEKLKSIKVLDPACGSGAFLVKVFDYLQNEWREVQNHVKTEWSYKDILTHNIYGVDINPASTGITKLSLWLKTAHYREPLTTLDGNIKIGNSLIDDEVIAGYYSEFEGKVIQETITRDLLTHQELDKLTAEGVKKSLAFKWNDEFKEVFDTGGFDVVVGNPPYVNVKYDIYSQYKTQKVGDLYVYFVERGLNLLKENSYLSFIIPSLFEKGMKYDIFRQYLLENTTILEIQNKGDKVFEEVQMPTSIVRFQKRKIPNQKWICNDDNIISKMEFNSVKVGEFTKIMRGLEIGKDIIDLKGDVKIISGEDILRYGINSYGFISNETFNEFKKDEYYFSGDRVLIRETGSRITATFTNENLQSTRSLYSIKSDTNNLYYLIAIINSKLIQFYYAEKFKTNTDIFPKIRIGQVRELPIPQIPITEQQPLIAHAQKMLDLTKQFNELSNKFTKLLGADLGVAKITKKLEKWYNLQTDEFFAEVGKQNKNLSLSQKSQWLEHFEAEKQKALALQNQITKTDSEIDKMVYELYGLSEEEAGVVEGLIA